MARRDGEAMASRHAPEATFEDPALLDFEAPTSARCDRLDALGARIFGRYTIAQAGQGWGTSN
jgi:hypothetical protein